jgi:predicted PhzF superfamily epimerase YddE/YHI9
MQRVAAEMRHAETAFVVLGAEPELRLRWFTPAVEVDRCATPGWPARRAPAPDFARLATVECRGVIVTAAAEDGADHDFVSRFFAPRVGVDEDRVTGPLIAR